MSIWSALLSPLSDAYKSRQDRKAKEKEVDNALQEKKLEAMQRAESAEIALSIAQVNSAGWKDDWFTLLFSVPFVMAFIPLLQEVAREGLLIIEGYPTWLKAYLGSAVAASFGLHTVDRAWKMWHS